MNDPSVGLWIATTTTSVENLHYTTLITFTSGLYSNPEFSGMLPPSYYTAWTRSVFNSERKGISLHNSFLSSKSSLD